MIKKKGELELNASIIDFYKLYAEELRFTMQSIRVLTGIIFPIAILIFAEVIINGEKVDFTYKIGIAFISIFLMSMWYWLIKNWGVDGYILSGMLKYIEERTGIFNLKKKSEIGNEYKRFSMRQHKAYTIITLVFSISWFVYLGFQGCKAINYNICSMDISSTIWAILLIILAFIYIGIILVGHWNSTIDDKILRIKIKDDIDEFLDKIKKNDN